MTKKTTQHPLALLPELSFTAPEPITASSAASSSLTIPSDEDCFALWDSYSMLENIRAHSLLVAGFATLLAQKAEQKGHKICTASVRAGALLHDIAKSYTILHGGSHAQMGASIVIQHTGNRYIAQGVAMHVHWPWKIPQNICALPFFIIYADKRIMHDTCVTLKARYKDLLVRYGTNEQHRKNIRLSYEQGRNIEKALSALLECDLHAYTFDSGRLVKRA